MRDRPVPWQVIFRRLSQQYGWTPEQIGQLTLPQVFLYLISVNSGEPVELPPDEARELVRQRQQQKSAWIENQLQRIFPNPQAE